MLTFSATGDGGGGGAPSAADERPRQRSLARLQQQRTLAMRQGRAEGPWRSELLTAQLSSWVVSGVVDFTASLGKAELMAKLFFRAHYTPTVH